MAAGASLSSIFKVDEGSTSRPASGRGRCGSIFADSRGVGIVVTNQEGLTPSSPVVVVRLREGTLAGGAGIGDEYSSEVFLSGSVSAACRNSPATVMQASSPCSSPANSVCVRRRAMRTALVANCLQRILTLSPRRRGPPATSYAWDQPDFACPLESPWRWWAACAVAAARSGRSGGGRGATG